MFYFPLNQYDSIMRYSIVIIILLQIIPFSCEKDPNDVRVALRYAGDNRKELKKVIKHYSGEEDSLKLKAVYHILGNLPQKFHFLNENTDSILKDFNERIPDLKDFYSSRQLSYEIMYDSLLYKHPDIFHKNDPRMDIFMIKSELLIENIEMAFFVWENMPWTKNLSYECFRDYILPFKILNTKPEFWRKNLFNEFRWVIDSMKTSDDPVQACILINDHLKSNYTHHAKVNPNNLSQMINLQGGGCEASSVYACYVMRAMGIPTNITNTIIAGYPPFEGRHVENYVLTKDLKILRFQGCLKSPYDHQEWQDDFRGKWFYESEIINEKWITEIISDDKEVPPSLKNNRLVDITSEASISYNLFFNIDKLISREVTEGEYAFLCVSTRRGGWTAIDFAKIVNDSVVFSGITPGVFFPMRYYEGNYHQLAGPVKLTIDGSVIPLLLSEDIGSNDTQSLRLYRKYPMNQHVKEWSTFLVGDKIQCSNDSLFTNSTTLYTIKDSTHHITDVKIEDSNFYRYIRYKIETYNCATKLVDLRFFGIKDEKELELKGNYIYFPKNDPRLLKQFDHAFDDDYWTFFHLDPFTPEIDNLWFGFDLAEPTRISKIRYMCRSDLNCIVPGNLYELFYLKGAKWISIEKKIAKEVFIEFHEVPSNRIYYLKNLTEGVEEYFFTYVNGKQVWW